MDGDASVPPPLYGGLDRGAGGKLRKERKPPSTPYDRPPRRNDDGGGGWISRIVTPAKRLLSGGATLLLPSFFSSLPPPLEESPTRDEGQPRIHQETKDNDENSSADPVLPKSIGKIGPCEAKGKSILNIDDEEAPDKLVHSDGLPCIEQLIKGKTFSREEIDRLMEILQSRVADAKQEIEPSKSGQGEVERAETSYGKQKVSTDIEEELDKYNLGSSTPFPRLTVQNEVCASPVDIARAYMGSRKPEVGFTSTSIISNSEKFSLGSEFPSKTFMPSPLQKAPICWPGAMTQDQPGYSTPQSQKSRYGLQSFPRTPYSRTMYTKSKSKLTPLLRDNERLANISSTPFQPMRTPIYGKSVTNAAERSYGTGGPFRRVRHNSISATPSRESTLLRTVQPSHMAKESNLDFMLRKNFEPGTSGTNNSDAINKAQNSEIGAPKVHPHSSKLARQILEQLDRPITLKEKSEELKTVASWKSSSQGVSTTPFPNSSLKIMNSGSAKLPIESNGKDVASTSVISLDKATSGSNIGMSSRVLKLDSQRANPDQATTDNLPSGNGQPWIIGAQTRQQNITNNSARFEPQNVQRKPVLSLISINKSVSQTLFASDTSAGFTFPSATSSITASEPPTPSIIPSLSASPEQPKISIPLPAVTVGDKITIAPPVNASPPTSSPSTQNDASIPNFKFGSGKTRLSFAIEGEDADSVPNDNSSVPQYKFGSGQNRVNFGSVGNDAVVC